MNNENMNDQEINIAIAEALGLDVIHDPAGPKGRPDAWKTAFFTPKAAKQRRIAWPSSAVVKVVPKYCRDLNAMHEATMSLEGPIRDHSFRRALAKSVGVIGVEDWEHSLVCLDKLTNATARQRAEAFLRTIGKWEEDAK